MSHHNHSLMNIHHSKGQILRTIVLICFLVMTILWGPVFGVIGAGIRLMLGLIVFLWLPGRRITKALWQHDEIDLFERFILSFAFSISVVPLVVFYSNLLGMPVNEWLVIGAIVCIIGISYIGMLQKKKGVVV